MIWWSTAVDLYCERLNPQFLAEPLNFFTNAAFLLLASLSWWQNKKEFPQLSNNHRNRTLHILFFTVGIGSALFHSFATLGTQALDVIPIVVFLVYYLYAVTIASSHKVQRDLIVNFSIFIFLNALFIGLIDAKLVNGSNTYFGACIFLFFFGWRCNTRYPEQSRQFIGTGFIFLVSLAMRSIDEAVCAAFPIGTHFLWHLLNSVVLYRCLRSYVAIMGTGKELASR